MKARIIHFALMLFCSLSIWASNPKEEKRLCLDLSGSWSFALDSTQVGQTEQWFNKSFAESVSLPGTTDTNKKGKKNLNRTETSHLSRRYTYEGVAWYSKEIVLSNEWDNKEIILFLERTRPSTVWVNDQLVGSCEYLSVPHRYNLTPFLKPGKQRITICVDNGQRIPKQIRSNSHSCTESTQTNWNGVIGRIELQGSNPLHIASIQTYPDIEQKTVKVLMSLSKEPSKDHTLKLEAHSFNSGNTHTPQAISCPIRKGVKDYEIIYPLGNDALLWSEFDPALYRITATLQNCDRQMITLGLKEFKVDNKQFSINGNTTFLRGKHDACVFPITAHTPMDVESWRKYFQTAKAYGINHVRFHSWCPPMACFEAADMEGIYLQPELTIWGSFDKKNEELMSFLLQDGIQIQKEYSNQPSFVLFALGNELSGDLELMKSFISTFRTMEDRHLYAYGSNNYLGWKGYIPGEDFLVTCRIGEGEGYSTHTRCSFSFADAEQGGYLNNTYPNTTLCFDQALEKAPVPVIGHETGQFQIYPNFKEIDKYTGVLSPVNFNVFAQRLNDAGMAEQAEDFFKASGALSLLLYRADIEANLRTKNMAGFQVLDLQDYPGQGSAYVGILDAFMDSKGLITPKQWKEFCNEIVPLWITSKFCWSAGEQLKGELKLADYSNKEISSRKLLWQMRIDGTTFKTGNFQIPSEKGLIDIGDLSLILPNLTKACQADLLLEIEGTNYKNSYPLWIYPENDNIQNRKEIHIASRIDDQMLQLLRNKEKVLLIPRKDSCVTNTVAGLFQSDYWNYRMFKSICDHIKKPASPGTLGLLTNPQHPIFNEFPTEYHTNWQWFSIIKESYPLILDRMPKDYKPIVQVIDNIERNHKLGLVFEFNIEGGKLLVCMADLEKAFDKPEARQLYSSILSYMESAQFKPTASIDANDLTTLFNTDIATNNIPIIKNISYE